MFIKIKRVELIKSASDQFVMSQPNGNMIAIDGIELHDEKGFVRMAKVGKELFEAITNGKIEIKN